MNASAAQQLGLRVGDRLAVSLLILVSAVPFAAGSSINISPEPMEAFQGGIVPVRVSGTGLQGVQALRNGVKIPFFPSGSQGSYFAFVGVDFEEKPGPTKFVIKVWGQRGHRLPVELRVKKMEFPTEHLSVPASFDRFDQATLTRIRREQGKMRNLWSRSSGRRLWQGQFVVPVPGEKTSAFGRRRVINGTPRSPHSGVDLRAALGAPILAANHGTVVLRDEFFFNGKSIVLDHGWGFYTMYFHLSDFRLEEGSQVRKGEVIGWVGMTGRVTGPHLHWGVRLNEARVDPVSTLNTLDSSQIFCHFDSTDLKS